MSSIGIELSPEDLKILGGLFNFSENTPSDFEKRELCFAKSKSKDLQTYLPVLLAKYNTCLISLLKTVGSYKKFKIMRSRLASMGKEIENCWLELKYRQEVNRANWLCRFDILTRTGRLNRDTILKILGEKPR